jgi:hypothetical protein
VIARMREAENKGRAAAEGLAIAREIVSGVRPLVQGIQISMVAGAVETALSVIESVEA